MVLQASPIGAKTQGGIRDTWIRDMLPRRGMLYPQGDSPPLLEKGLQQYLEHYCRVKRSSVVDRDVMYQETCLLLTEVFLHRDEVHGIDGPPGLWKAASEAAHRVSPCDDRALREWTKLLLRARAAYMDSLLPSEKNNPGTNKLTNVLDDLTAWLDKHTDDKTDIRKLPPTPAKRTFAKRDPPSLPMVVHVPLLKRPPIIARSEEERQEKLRENREIDKRRREAERRGHDSRTLVPALALRSENDGMGETGRAIVEVLHDSGKDNPSPNTVGKAWLDPEMDRQVREAKGFVGPGGGAMTTTATTTTTTTTPAQPKKDVIPAKRKSDADQCYGNGGSGGSSIMSPAKRQKINLLDAKTIRQMIKKSKKERLAQQQQNPDSRVQKRKEWNEKVEAIPLRVRQQPSKDKDGVVVVMEHDDDGGGAKDEDRAGADIDVSVDGSGDASMQSDGSVFE